MTQQRWFPRPGDRVLFRVGERTPLPCCGHDIFPNGVEHTGKEYIVGNICEDGHCKNCGAYIALPVAGLLCDCGVCTRGGFMGFGAFARELRPVEVRP